MSDYNTMTAQQCADWLAERDGCKFEHGPYGGYWVKRAADGTILSAGDHPYPMTLDAAAAALREPWEWDAVGFWTASVDAYAKNRANGYSVYADAPDELTARYRVAVAARMEDDK